jgi:hypothetical protein
MDFGKPSLDGMKVVIFVRQTEDWATCDFDTLHYIEPPKFTYKDVIREYFEPISSISYFEFRRRMKEIAGPTLPEPVVVGPEIGFLEELDDNDLVVPTDDDDWFRHQFSEMVKERFPHCDFICWNVMFNISAYSYQQYPWWPTHHDVVASNGYAMRVSYLRSLSARDRFTSLHHHMKAYPIALEQGAKIDMRDGLFLSAYNAHPASLSVLSTATSKWSFQSAFPQEAAPTLPLKWQCWQSQYEALAELIRRVRVTELHSRGALFL